MQIEQKTMFYEKCYKTHYDVRKCPEYHLSEKSSIYQTYKINDIQSKITENDECQNLMLIYFKTQNPRINDVNLTMQPSGINKKTDKVRILVDDTQNFYQDLLKDNKMMIMLTCFEKLKELEIVYYLDQKDHILRQFIEYQFPLKIKISLKSITFKNTYIMQQGYQASQKLKKQLQVVRVFYYRRYSYFDRKSGVNRQNEISKVKQWNTLSFFTNLKSVRPIQNIVFSSLKILNLSSCKLETVQPLARLRAQQLNQIYLINNNLFNVDSLAKLQSPFISTIFIGQNYICDIPKFSRALVPCQSDVNIAYLSTQPIKTFSERKLKCLVRLFTLKVPVSIENTYDNEYSSVINALQERKVHYEAAKFSQNLNV